MTPSHTAPSVPGNFALSSATGSPRQLEASWTIPDPANGVIQSYTVTCNESITFNFPGSQSAMVSVTLNDQQTAQLAPFTVYECTVSAATNGGVGPVSEPSIARTVEDGEKDILYSYKKIKSTFYNIAILT